MRLLLGFTLVPVLTLLCASSSIAAGPLGQESAARANYGESIVPTEPPAVEITPLATTATTPQVSAGGVLSGAGAGGTTAVPDSTTGRDPSGSGSGRDRALPANDDDGAIKQRVEQGAAGPKNGALPFTGFAVGAVAVLGWALLMGGGLLRRLEVTT